MMDALMAYRDPEEVFHLLRIPLQSDLTVAIQPSAARQECDGGRVGSHIG